MADPQLMTEVMNLRQSGYTDEQVSDELLQRGYQDDQVQEALSGGSAPPAPTMAYQRRPQPSAAGPYERIEEVAEAIIDEKWDALLAEVRKVIDWKSKVEDDLRKALNDLENMKGDMKELRQAVLGKVEDYDKRMLEVGTELKAVSKVFKDVIPMFTDNVKELSSLTSRLKK